MGKKKKKRRKQSKYNKAQFVNIICAACQICGVYEPTFCYDEMYKKSPEIFMEEVYPRLLRQKLWIDRSQNSVAPVQIMQFREMFCFSSMCGKGYKYTCPSALECFNAFRGQMSKGVGGKRQKVKRKKQNANIIFEAYFFISEDKTFQEEVKGILSNGN